MEEKYEDRENGMEGVSSQRRDYGRGAEEDGWQEEIRIGKWEEIDGSEKARKREDRVGDREQREYRGGMGST